MFKIYGIMLSGRETNYNDLASLSFCDRGQPDGARLPHRLLPCLGHPPSATGRTNTTYWSSPHTIHTIHTQFNTDQSLITFSITHSSTGSHRVASLCVQLYVFGAAAVTAWLIWGRICPPPAPLPRHLGPRDPGTTQDTATSVSRDHSFSRDNDRDYPGTQY